MAKIDNNTPGIILKVMEPKSEDEWRWFPLNKLPSNLYSPSEKFIKAYLESEKM